ncbi:MAG: hypothetical protein BGO87_04085 [Flavobacteriia bacterium 40-80]|nr:MAG: hypothetical protein BGO87_04085 [Flavobacteriia bacterium 40-80]
MVEIERKFLVNEEKWRQSCPENGVLIRQGYIFDTEKGILRIRIKGTKGFLTVKSQTVSMTRSEFEYEIPVNEAEMLLDKMCDACLSKTRYSFKAGDHSWEIDEFHGKLAPLILAEIELKDESEQFELPDFVGREVTFDKQYYNSELIKK